MSEELAVTFEVAAGTVAGRDHVAAGKNNQDAHALRAGSGVLAAVACDGCGSAPGSEAGARIGARLVAEAIRRHAPELDVDPATALAGVRADVLGALGALAEAMGGSREDAVIDHLLFTILAAVVTPARAYVLGCGDGIWGVNGAVEIRESPGNAPPYLAYGLLDTGPEIEIRCAIPTERLESCLLATDGAAAFWRSPQALLPGRHDPAGPPDRFWRENRFFTNPAALGRWLRLCARESARIDWDRHVMVRQPGLLADDTTVVVLRRKGRAP